MVSRSRLFKNAERARTCNSIVTKVPGMFASVNNSTDPETNTIISYISNAGIPSIASQKQQYLEVITPYSVFPTVLFDKSVGMAWWRNMLQGKKMQSMSQQQRAVGQRPLSRGALTRGNFQQTRTAAPSPAASTESLCRPS